MKLTDFLDSILKAESFFEQVTSDAITDVTDKPPETRIRTQIKKDKEDDKLKCKNSL